jgi:2-hydroxy-3-oxopropionate reductase
MNIGFVGVGIMGRPMAAHLQAAGHELLLVQHRSPLPQELLDGGATVCASACEVARRAEIIILMLPDTSDVERALFGAEGVAAGLSAGKCVVDMSSIDPIATRGFAEKIGVLDAQYADAPVSGGELGAKNAALTIMCGAEPEVFERVKPLFELMGKNITLVGGVGASSGIRRQGGRRSGQGARGVDGRFRGLPRA